MLKILKSELEKLLKWRIQMEKQGQMTTCAGPFYEPILPKEYDGSQLKFSKQNGEG